MNHTPTPWDVHKLGNGSLVISAANGRRVCAVDNEIERDTAEHLAKCVNAHGDMLNALAECIYQIEYLRGHMTPKWRSFTTPTSERVLSQARAAIAKSQGE